MNKKALEDECRLLVQKEKKFIASHSTKKSSIINDKIGNKIPSGLQDKLDFAFLKAFEITFEKGTSLIEKTYNKEGYEQNFKIRKFTANVKSDKKSLRPFMNSSRSSTMKNLAFSGVEGIGLGVLGVGLPDIPLFVGVILKSIYEISLNYGFDYTKDTEKIFIMQVIRTALFQGEDFPKKDKAVNELISYMNTILLDPNTIKMDTTVLGPDTIKLEIDATSQALSEELLYMKFIQGIPLIGIAGGLADFTCLKKITDYATLKYQRRFLSSLKI